MVKKESGRKCACITGASRGIGRALAQAFAERGYDLYLTCRHREDLLCALKEQLERACHVTCHTFVGDIGDFDHCAHLFSAIRERSGRLDVLVNNAAMSYRGLLQEMDIADWHNLMRTNLDAVFYTCRLAIPLMLARHAGKILNISSVWGSAGASLEVAYAASKGGVNTFTKALAKELAPSNIQVNALSCGAIDTEMNAFLRADERAALEGEIPAGRFGTPEEVASLALALCTDHPYLTGQILTLDGAWI